MNKTHARRSIHNNILCVSNFVRFPFHFESRPVRQGCRTWSVAPLLHSPSFLPSWQSRVESRNILRRSSPFLAACGALISKQTLPRQPSRSGRRTNKQADLGGQAGRRHREAGNSGWSGSWEQLKFICLDFRHSHSEICAFPPRAAPAWPSNKNCHVYIARRSKKKETEGDRRRGRQTDRQAGQQRQTDKHRQRHATVRGSLLGKDDVARVLQPRAVTAAAGGQLPCN